MRRDRAIRAAGSVTWVVCWLAQWTLFGVARAFASLSGAPLEEFLLEVQRDVEKRGG